MAPSCASRAHAMPLARPRPRPGCFREAFGNGRALCAPYGMPTRAHSEPFWAPIAWHAHAAAMHYKNATPLSSLSFFPILSILFQFSSLQNLMDRKRKSTASKGKEKLTALPRRKSPRLAGLSPALPPISPKTVLKPNKLLVLALAANALDLHSKQMEVAKTTLLEEQKVTKGKRTAKNSVKPVRCRFSQRIIAKDGPSRPKPKKVEVINLSSDDEAEEKGKEAAVKQPILVANQEEVEEEEE
ncbi:hypothetical protein PIB30_033078 [Stylosanthes scabra]|uniref:Uncharacterized protein n=1 Tax=Stylosanthes scabra TaxID=79078 RepID=A0ABU6QBT7_9FABA|nr:hypothetical protein [Stylosanthes scabra]